METNEFKVISYNIAGLPVNIDLNELPWYLKPIAWIYKLIKKTTIIPLNTEGPGHSGTVLEGKKLLEGDYDIIGVQEDFNYHNDLYNTISEKYNQSTFTGGLELSKFGKLVHFYWNQLPTFRIDGLNIFTKKSRIKVLSENIVKWDAHYGYFDHANDALMDKGFRHMMVKIDDKIDLDVYDLHMDASWGNDSDEQTEDSLARRSQFEQLAKYINNTNTINPIIIMGDTNSSYKYKSDRDNLSYFIELLNPEFELNDAGLKCEGKVYDDIDKIFYINNTKSNTRITATKCYFDYTFTKSDKTWLSDHSPIVCGFIYTNNKF